VRVFAGARLESIHGCMRAQAEASTTGVRAEADLGNPDSAAGSQREEQAACAAAALLLQPPCKRRLLLLPQGREGAGRLTCCIIHEVLQARGEQLGGEGGGGHGAHAWRRHLLLLLLQLLSLLRLLLSLLCLLLRLPPPCLVLCDRGHEGTWRKCICRK